MMKIFNFNFKEKSVFNYIGVASVALALAFAIAGPVMKGFAERSFEYGILVVLILGMIAAIFAFISDVKYLPLIPVILFATALGLTLYYGAPIIADHYNELNWNNGDYSAVVTYCILGALTCAASITACFDTKK